MSRVAVSSRGERGWRGFAIAMLGFAAFGGAAGAIGTVVNYHTLTTQGVRTTAVVDSVWRVKGGWNCSVSFTDTDGSQRTETVSGCGGVQRGQVISVTYDRSDPSTIDPTGSVTAPRKLGLAAFLLLLSGLCSFSVWAVLCKPAWDARRNRRSAPLRQPAKRRARKRRAG